MHPTSHRGLRELYAMTRRLRDHWRVLATRLDATAPDQSEILRRGSELARTLLRELTGVTAARGLYGRPMAQGLGAQLAGMQNLLLDTALEINQVLRFAVLDVVRVVSLLDFLARAAEHDADAQLQGFLEGWAVQMRAQEESLRTIASALGDDPGLAVRACAPGVAGRVGHGAANVLGTFGEWVDRRAGR